MCDVVGVIVGDGVVATEDDDVVGVGDCVIVVNGVDVGGAVVVGVGGCDVVVGVTAYDEAVDDVAVAGDAVAGVAAGVAAAVVAVWRCR